MYFHLILLFEYLLFSIHAYNINIYIHIVPTSLHFRSPTLFVLPDGFDLEFPPLA